MEQRYYTPREYFQVLRDNLHFSELGVANCDYCRQERKENRYHPGTCAYCGASLRGLTLYVLDRITGVRFEAICV